MTFLVGNIFCTLECFLTEYVIFYIILSVFKIEKKLNWIEMIGVKMVNYQVNLRIEVFLQYKSSRGYKLVSHKQDSNSNYSFQYNMKSWFILSRSTSIEIIRFMMNFFSWNFCSFSHSFTNNTINDLKDQKANKFWNFLE